MIYEHKKKSKLTVMNDIMNDIVKFFNELCMTKGHNLRFVYT